MKLKTVPLKCDGTALAKPLRELHGNFIGVCYFIGSRSVLSTECLSHLSERIHGSARFAQSRVVAGSEGLGKGTGADRPEHERRIRGIGTPAGTSASATPTDAR